jgi:glycine/D-amino acid oxidase-like deaminating enzyme
VEEGANNMKIVVIGGNAAGASAAVKARRVNEDARILILEKRSYLSFANILAVWATPHPFPLSLYFGTLTLGLGYFPLDYEP